MTSRYRKKTTTWQFRQKHKKKSHKGGKKKPTAKKNSKAIKKLFRRTPPKIQYTQLIQQPVNDTNGGSQYTNPNFFTLPLDAVDTMATGSGGLYSRVDGTTQVRLKKLKVSFSIETQQTRFCPQSARYYVALVRSIYKDLSGEISAPRVIQMFDPNAADWGNNKLPPWKTYRTIQNDILETVKVLKTWQGELSNIDAGIVVDADAATPPNYLGTLQHNALRTRHMRKHTHLCNNALAKFQTQDTVDPINARYFLLFLTDVDVSMGVSAGCVVNASCKLTYSDS